MRFVFLVYILNDRNNHKYIQCFIFKDLAFSRNAGFAVKITDVNKDVCNMHSDFAVEPFALFSFTRDYLDHEMFNIFYVLGVYVKNVYFA